MQLKQQKQTQNFITSVTVKCSKYVRQSGETGTLFLMLRARFAYLRVFNVSTKSQSDGDMQAIIVVLLHYNK